MSEEGRAGAAMASLRSRHETGDWLMLLALTVMWGSSFLFTKLAVAVLAFEHVVTARLSLAALILLVLTVGLGRRWPRGWRTWLFFVLIAVIGNLLPFSLITWGQRGIDSGLAGILMAIMPLATLVLAHLFVPGERLTPPRIGGFLLGLTGVVVLIGPEALHAALGEEAHLLPMLAVLGGALCYGVASILARLRPGGDALCTAAAVTLLAALLSLPAALLQGVPAPLALPRGLTPLDPDLLAPLGAVMFLGVFATATAMLVYFRLIQSAGPGFTAQLNYLIPLWAVAVGVLFLGEHPRINHLYGLGLILGGLLVARWRGRG